MIRATIKPILTTRKTRGSRNAAASFQTTMPTRPTAVQLHDRLEHHRNSVEGDQTNTHGFAERVKRCRRSGEELRGLGAGWWRRPHTRQRDRKSTRLNSSHVEISYAVFCLKKKKKKRNI